MCTATVDFHFDFGSPNAYLCHKVAPAFAARNGLRFNYVPILLGGIFKATGNRSPLVAFAPVANKLRYLERDTERFIARHAITDFVFSPHFPVNTVTLMRGAIAAQKLGVFGRYVSRMFHFMWAVPRKLDDPAILYQTLHEDGFDADTILALSQDPAIKQELIENTAEAVKRGVFGAPTFFFDGDIFFGKESLLAIEDLLVARST